jgi:hypothetical protein
MNSSIYFRKYIILGGKLKLAWDHGLFGEIWTHEYDCNVARSHGSCAYCTISTVFIRNAASSELCNVRFIESCLILGVILGTVWSFFTYASYSSIRAHSDEKLSGDSVGTEKHDKWLSTSHFFVDTDSNNNVHNEDSSQETPWMYK